MKYKTKLIFTIFLFPLLILTFAYVAFTTTFSLKKETDKQDIEIEKVTMIDASNSIAITNPEIKDNTIDLDISFLKNNDYVEYEVLLKNNNKEQIEIKNILFDEKFNNNYKLNYTISYEPSKQIESESSIVLKIKISSNEIMSGNLKIIFIL